ncbi:sensor histidine kinase [Planctomycetes bacterium K23_9]|uniref:histidine kinase n=1 Tax=Stieleria marina TaxID=1930275 RepID=A0A517NP82_9BACT|nr:Phytochrome-like protein cph1 [Planctomycetes bacterium K23_9]
MLGDNHQPSLRRRIYRTCVGLVALCVLSTAIGWIGQTKLIKFFAVYERSEQTLSKVGELDRNVQELKARSEKYLSTGNKSQLTTALGLQRSLLSQIDNVNQQTNATGLHQTLSEMKQSLIMFADQLKHASQERDLRTRLVFDDLPSQYDSVEQSINQLILLASEEATGLDAELVELVQSHASSYQSLQKYFIEPDYIAFRDAMDGIATSRSLVETIEEKNDSAAVLELCALLKKKLVDFKSSGTRAFQATRGYMYYSNVVMSGEISEFVHFSDKVKRFVESNRELNRQRRTNATTQSRWFGLLASLAALAFAIWMAARLSYRIVVPISRITETFRKLGMGQTVDEIPALDQDDEIGRMARAARIFNEKNLETRELLHRSQRLSDELADKAKALELTNQELDNFAYIASHDLKSPLRGINHLAQWVQEDCGDQLPEESQLHLQQMQERVIKMEMLLNELLEYSRAGRIDAIPEVVDTHQIVHSIVSLIEVPRGIRIEAMPPSVEFYTSKTPLNQVLLNLITNGVKYIDRESGGEIKVRADRVGDWMHFEVSDNGPGIEPKFHKKVFEMYQRVTNAKVEGTGMGLAIVKKQVERLGGEISLKSKLGQGAVFSFTWPCSNPADVEIPGSADAIGPEPTDSSHGQR